MVNLLEEMTRSISTDAVSISLITPFLNDIGKDDGNDRCVQTMKKEIPILWNKHYMDVKSCKRY